MLPSVHRPLRVFFSPLDPSFNSMVNHFQHFLAHSLNSLDPFQSVVLFDAATNEPPPRPGPTTERGDRKLSSLLEGLRLLSPCWWSRTSRLTLKLPGDHTLFSTFMFFSAILDGYFLLSYSEISLIFFPSPPSCYIKKSDSLWKGFQTPAVTADSLLASGSM